MSTDIIARGLGAILREDLAASTGAAHVGFKQSGSGAATRTVQDKLRETVSVTDYWNAVDPDDTNSFTRALATGKRVFVPAGMGHDVGGAYAVDHVLLVTNAYIFGEGAATVIRPVVRQDVSGATPAAFYYKSPDPAVQITDVVIRDLTLYGRVQQSGFWEFNHLIHVGGVRRMLIQNVTFKGFQGDGIAIAAGEVGATERHNYDITIRDCFFDGITRDNRNGISVIDCDKILITGCRFYRCSRNTMPGPIDIEPDNFGFYIARDIIVENCTFDSCGGNVAQVGVFSGSSVQTIVGFIVRNCIFRNYVGTGAHMAYNISRQSQGDGSIDSHVQFIGNHTYGPGRPFDFYSGRGLLVADNVFEGQVGSALVGYRLADIPYAYARDVTITRNRWVRPNNPSGGHSIIISNVDDLSVTDNEWYDIGNNSPNSSCMYFVEGGQGLRHTVSDNRLIMAAGRVGTFVFQSSFTWNLSTNQAYRNAYPAGSVNNFFSWEGDRDYPFTPVVEGEGTAGVGTYTRQQGTFRKQGKRVFFDIQIDGTNHTGNGLIKISLPPITPQVIQDGDIIPVTTVVYGTMMAYTAGEIPVGMIHTYATTSISAGSIRMWKMQPDGGFAQMVIAAAKTYSMRFQGSYACV